MSREEIQDLIEQKKVDLGGLITDEGAAFIVARELGAEILQGAPAEEGLTTSTLAPGMRNVNLTGRVLKIYQRRTFEKEGETNVVQTLLLGDKDGRVKLVLWGPDTHPVAEGSLERGSLCRIIGGYVRRGLDGRIEVHKGRRGKLQIDPEDLDPNDYPDPAKNLVTISELTPGEDDIDFHARVSEVGPLRTFTKKDGTMGRLSWLTVEDETTSTRLVFWNERAEETLEFHLGDIIRVEGANCREGLHGIPEVHLGRLTRISQIRDETLVTRLEAMEPPSHESFTIKEIVLGRQITEVLGKIAGVGQSREFTRKDGSKSKVMNLLLTDQTGMIRVVLWGDQVQNGELLARGDIVKITNAYTRSGRSGVELHLGDRSELIKNPNDIDKTGFDPPTLEMNQLQPEMSAVSFKGRLLEAPQTREFTRADGSEGRVASVDVADRTGACRVVAWGNDVEKLASLEENDTILVTGGSIREGRDGIESHLSELSQITILEHEEIDLGEIELDVAPPGEKLQVTRKNISQTKTGDIVELRATLVKMFDRDPTYLACPQCFKKVRQKDATMKCSQHGAVEPINRMIFSVILDDGSNNIRATLGGEIAEHVLQMSADDASRLGNELGLPEAPILREKQRLEGQEWIVRGRVRTRRDRDELDLIVYEVQIPTPQDELDRLLKITQPE